MLLFAKAAPEECFVAFLLPQEVSCIIPLKELQQMRMLQPISGGLPGLELNYGSADSPKTIWFELSQVRPACTYSSLLADPNLPSTAETLLKDSPRDTSPVPEVHGSTA